MQVFSKRSSSTFWSEERDKHMNEDKPALTANQNKTDAAIDTGNEYSPEARADARDSHGSRVVPALLVLCLIGVGVLGWQWWDMRSTLATTQDELTRRLSESDDAARTARAGVNQVQDNVITLQGKIGLLEAKSEETRGQAAALDSLYQEFSRSRDDRLMAEVDQAVGIAGQQLELAGNVEAALIALQDAKLASAGDARLMPLRRAVARDIERLRAAPRVDITGVTLKLENLLESVDQMPLAFTVEAAANPAPEKTPKGAFMDDPLAYLRALGKDLWAELRSLIRVERIDASAEPVLLSPSQSTYLRENLKIRLLTARLALLGRDQQTFAADTAQAVDWIKRYFNLNDERVSGMLASLEAVQKTPIAPERPELTETMAALATLQGRPVSAAPAEQESTEPEPAATEPESAATEPEPAATEPEPAATEPEPQATEPASEATEPAPQSTSSSESAPSAAEAVAETGADATESAANSVEQAAEAAQPAVDAAESAPQHEAPAETPATSPAKE